MHRYPRLKSIAIHSGPGQVVLWHRALRRTYLDDPTGAVAAMLRLLREGTRDVDGLTSAMVALGHPVSATEVSAVVGALDDLCVLEATGGDEALPAEVRARHESNLRFYDLFARLDRTSASMHSAAADAHVLLLGAGGVGSGVLQSMAGLGVGRITLVDIDTVEVKNLARQFVYGTGAIGRPKVEAARDWVAGYSPATAVIPVHRRIAAPDDVVDLGTGVDVVVCAIDSPDDVHLILNEACFRLGVPYVAGGLNYSTLSYWSVEPGVSACRACLERHREDERAGLDPVLRGAPDIDRIATNRATGPVVQVVSGLMAMEAMRYITRADPPVAAATYHLIELADRMETSISPWTRHPDCPCCAGGTGADRAERVTAGTAGA